MKAFTYFEPIDDAQFAPHAPLVEAWKRNWASRGWETIVLSSRHAEAHPAIQRWVEWALTLKAINHRRYQLACFVRWLALAQVMRPGEVALFVDYDVFNVGFSGADALRQYAPAVVTNLHYGQCSQPVVIDYRQAQAIPAIMMAVTALLDRARPHQIDWNDMSFWEEDKKGKLGFARYVDLCLPYATDATAPLLHLSYDAVHPTGKTKLEIWKELEARHGV